MGFYKKRELSFQEREMREERERDGLRIFEEKLKLFIL